MFFLKILRCSKIIYLKHFHLVYLKFFENFYEVIFTFLWISPEFSRNLQNIKQNYFLLFFSHKLSQIFLIAPSNNALSRIFFLVTQKILTDVVYDSRNNNTC